MYWIHITRTVGAAPFNVTCDKVGLNGGQIRGYRRHSDFLQTDQRNATDSWQEGKRVQVQPKVYPM